jgi:hypothetical protein
MELQEQDEDEIIWNEPCISIYIRLRYLD